MKFEGIAKTPHPPLRSTLSPPMGRGYANITMWLFVCGLACLCAEIGYL